MWCRYWPNTEFCSLLTSSARLTGCLNVRAVMSLASQAMRPLLSYNNASLLQTRGLMSRRGDRLSRGPDCICHTTANHPPSTCLEQAVLAVAGSTGSGFRTIWQSPVHHERLSTIDIRYSGQAVVVRHLLAVIVVVVVVASAVFIPRAIAPCRQSFIPVRRLIVVEPYMWVGVGIRAVEPDAREES